MKRTLTVILLSAFSTLAAQAAVPVRVGAVNVMIPNPDGYVAITQQMTEVTKIFSQFVPPSNELLTAFIPESAKQIANEGNVPHMDRDFIVEVARANINNSVSNDDFEQMKKIIQNSSLELTRRVEEKFPSIFTREDINLAQKYDLYLANATVKMIPLPIHYHTDDSFAFSLFIKYDTKHVSNTKTPTIGAATATFVHIKDKVIFLYCYSPVSDLSWSRQASERWVRAIIAANR